MRERNYALWGAVRPRAAYMIPAVSTVKHRVPATWANAMRRRHYPETRIK